MTDNDRDFIPGGPLAFVTDPGQEQISTGAFQSEIDARTIESDEALASPLISGGTEYFPEDIEHQHRVGICTAACRVQLRQKQTGKKYSIDFHYLCQKVFYDNNWQEGSSIMHANKVAKNIGFLPRDLFPHVTEVDRFLPYNEYVKRLQNISSKEIERLMTLCVDKIPGYASVNVNNPQSIAKAIDESQAGIQARFNIGENWWTPSWAASDIDPLRPPKNPTSGHAIIKNKFDYSSVLLHELANTWGTGWNMQGKGHVNWNLYKPTEAWADLYVAPVIPPLPTFKHKFSVDLEQGMKGPEVTALQKALLIDGVFPSTIEITDFFGVITLAAVKKFQTKYGIKPVAGYVGVLSRQKLNQLFNK